jgi:hypothetical protein
VRRLIKKSERTLTNIEYEEAKNIIKENEKSREAIDRINLVQLLDSLKECDKNDPYVMDILNQALGVLLRSNEIELIKQYYNDVDVFDSLKMQEENTEEKKNEEIRNITQYVGIVSEIKEEDIDDLLSKYVSNKELSMEYSFYITEILFKFIMKNKSNISEDFYFKYFDYIQFEKFIEDIMVPESILEKCIDEKRIKLEEVLKFQKLSQEFLNKYEKEIVKSNDCLTNIANYNKNVMLSEECILNNIEKITKTMKGGQIRPFLLKHNQVLSDEAVDQLFDYFSQFPQKSFPFLTLRMTNKMEKNLENNIDKLAEEQSDYGYFWSRLSYNEILSEDFIEKHKEDLDMGKVMINVRNLSEKFIEENIEDHDNWSVWHNICTNSKLSEDFISRHKDKVLWSDICRYQELSEEFMVEHKDKIDWFIALEHQKVSINFILNNEVFPYSQAYHRRIKSNKKIDQETLKKKKVYELLEKDTIIRR